FKKEVESLRLGAGEVFHGEGIVAVTKALLQSGVSYVGGYQGAPVSHLVDVLSDAQEILDEYGVHLETCANEAGAAAMLGASINYPIRGAVTWKSTVGTNVASDALSNLASAGVTGGALIIIGEDYGEGASIIQERTHAFALKSSMWLFDPRPHHPKFVSLIEEAFELSEESNTPVMMEFRIRACHVHGSFVCKDNIKPRISRNTPLTEPHHDFDRICLPPSTYMQEKQKVEVRLPAALDFIRRRELNEVFAGDQKDVGIILQGGMYNSTLRALHQLGLADSFGKSTLPLLVLNVVHPLVPEEITGFCQNKQSVLVIEEGNPDYIEQSVHVLLRKAGIDTPLHGKDFLPMAGEYTGEVLLAGLSGYVASAMPDHPAVATAKAEAGRVAENKRRAAELLGQTLPKRPPGFCVGCPERPVFSALQLAQQEVGEVHISADIGCHTFSTLPPFNLGNTVLGYGLGLASSLGVTPNIDKRVVTFMGDGGFWHNGLTSGVIGAQFNRNDSVLVVMNNGYSSATGQQYLPSTPDKKNDQYADLSIQDALRGVGVKWLKRVRTYDVREVAKTFKEALTTSVKGLKVILAEGECMLARHRRERIVREEKMKAGRRVITAKFGVDADICTGDHSCIRMSGCPSLTIKPSGDILKPDPVATVDSSCLACGLCGENAQAAALCPSFFQAEVVRNANLFDRMLAGVRRGVIAGLQALSGHSTASISATKHSATGANAA
ncbi:MAG: indolepyruvate ferredoxin oxidoreductase subunit alpha, partial [bacterium]